MSSIYDRCRIDIRNIRKIDNIWSHSTEIAGLCARVSSMSYALADQPDAQGVQSFPFRELSEEIRAKGTPKASAWFAGGGKEGGSGRQVRFEEDGPVRTFTTSVPGGSAFGLVIGDSLVVAFRGTANMADWGINLFGDGSIFPMTIPFLDAHAMRKGYLEEFQSCNRDAIVHAAFFRVAMALQVAVRHEKSRMEKEIADSRGVSSFYFDKLIYCGHSLGGALALLAPITGGNSLPAIYTFGMPRAVSAFAVPMLPTTHFRYVLQGDPVPTLPPRKLGFAHDVPALKLDPYLGLPHPHIIGKFFAGLSRGLPHTTNLKKGLANVFAAEHDLGAYIRTIDNMR